MPTTTSVCIEDADENQNGSSFNNTTNYVYLLQHVNTSLAKTVGVRFQVPDSIDPAAVTGGVLDLVRVANGSPGTTITVESDAPTLATNLTTRHGAAVTENGSVSWTPASGANGTVVSSADFGSVLASALTNTTPSGGYRTVAVLVKCNIGSPVGLQAASIEHTTYAEPKLQTTYSAPVNYTANLPAIAPDTTVSALLLDRAATTGVSALGTSEYAGTYRYVDVYPARSGTKPAAGWPTVMYVHGGGWTEGVAWFSASENGLHRPLVEKLVDAGYNVVSVSYRLLNVETFYAYIKLSWPQPLHDVRAGMEWYHANAAGYDADTDKVVIGGHSAGGMIAAFAGLSACRNDSTTYDGRQSPNGDRPAGYGYSDTASPWKFDLDEYGELSSALKPAGILIWDAPMDNYQMYDSISDPRRTINAHARRTLMGVVLGGSIPSATYDEADVNHYIDGTGGTSYSTAMSASDIPPIMFVSSTVEDVVTATAGITALEASLDTVGYDTSTANNTLNTVGGLSKYTTGQNHSNVIRQRSPWTEEMDWLAEVLGGGDVALAGATSATITTAGTLTAARPLSGTTTSATTAAGSLTVARALTGAVVADTTTTGALTAARPLTGSVAASTTAAGSLTATRALTGTTTALTSIAGAMLSAGLDELTGTITADTTAAGVVVATRTTTGTVTVSTAVAGVMSAPGQVQLAGIITADATTSGALVATRAMSGTTTVTTAAAGVVTVAGLDALTGAITADATLAGPLIATRSSSGAVSVATTAAGLVSVAGQDALTGTITVDTMAMGVLTATRVTAGVVIVDVTATGLLVATRAIAGGVTATTTATGAMTVAGQDALSGTITADVTAAGLLTAIRAISGVVTVTTDATGDMTAPGDAPMIGAVIVAVIVAGAMTASAPPTRAWQMTGRRPDVTRTDRRGVTAL